MLKCLPDPKKELTNQDIVTYFGMVQIMDESIKQKRTNLRLSGLIRSISQTYSRELDENNLPIGVDQLKLIMVTEDGLRITVEKN
jgi:hypothetical protein